MNRKHEKLKQEVDRFLNRYNDNYFNEGKKTQIINEGIKSKDLGEIFIEDESFDEEFPLSLSHYKLVEKYVKSQFKSKFDVVEAVVGDDERVIGISLSKKNVDIKYLSDLVDGKEKVELNIDSDAKFNVEFGISYGDYWITIDKFDGTRNSKLTKFNRIIEAKLVKIIKELTKTFF